MDNYEVCPTRQNNTPCVGQNSSHSRQVLPFGMRLEQTMKKKGQVCVGIDPHPHLLKQWDCEDNAAGLKRFVSILFDQAGDALGIVKPQSAFFERHGSAGIGVLEEVLHYCREHSILTILDVKRGDIGSTMKGYAQAYLDNSYPLAADALTVSPFLGVETLQETIDLAHQMGNGVFILCLTSNSEGKTVQHAIGSDNYAVARHIFDYANLASKADNKKGADIKTISSPTSTMYPGNISSVGVVIGATVRSAVTHLGLDLEHSNMPFLVPGLGAQGAQATDIAQLFGSALPQVIASVSRSVLGAGPQGVRAAIEETREAMAQALRHQCG